VGGVVVCGVVVGGGGCGGGGTATAYHEAFVSSHRTRQLNVVLHKPRRSRHVHNRSVLDTVQQAAQNEAARPPLSRAATNERKPVESAQSARYDSACRVASASAVNE